MVTGSLILVHRLDGIEPAGRHRTRLVATPENEVLTAVFSGVLDCVVASVPSRQ